MKTYIGGTYLKCGTNALHMSTHNICFHAEIAHNIFMPPHWMMQGAYSFSVFCMCIRMYVLLYKCVYVRTYDPVRLRLRHLYQVEFCSFIVRYLTAGASVYCGHISSFMQK